MLGKGLESLIPQKRGNSQNDDDHGAAIRDHDDSQGRATHKDDNNHDDALNHSHPSLSSSVVLPALPDGAGDGAADLNPAHELSSDSKISPQAKSAVLPTKGESRAVSDRPTSSLVSQTKPQTSASHTPYPIPDPRSPISESVFQIEVDRIEPNPGQPRRVFDQAALQDMAHSIREFGILQPLVVTKIEKETPSGIDISYQLIAGERRLMAAKLLGLRIVPAIVRKVGLEREKLELAIIENIQRENLNPLETARAFQRLQEEFRMTQREIAAKMGKSREVVANTVRLLDLPIYLQDALSRGELSESHARMLLGVDDGAAQKRLFEEIVANGLTTRDVKERVKAITKPRPYHHHMTSENLGAEVKAMQETLSASLGAPVLIQKGATNNGKITISFYSEEELENILRKLGKEEE